MNSYGNPLEIPRILQIKRKFCIGICLYIVDAVSAHMYNIGADTVSARKQRWMTAEVFSAGGVGKGR